MLMLCDKAYRVRVDRSKIHPQMLNLLLNSPEVLDEIDGMKTGISESGVNLTQAKFRELALSVPHIAEQTEIVRRVKPCSPLPTGSKPALPRRRPPPRA